ncbi:MAG TPA: hypothetical protein VI653_09880, partial [Steroidobacteraceae bacterium]
MSPSIVMQGRALAGVAGAGLVAAAECCPFAGAGAADWSFAPAAVMLAGLAGGWVGSTVCISISVTWILLAKQSVVGPVLLGLVGSALCAGLLRRRIRLPAVVAALITCFYAQQLNFQHVHSLLPPWTLVSSWLVAAMLNVAMAVLFMLFVPRRSRWFGPQCRPRIEDYLFLTAAC